MTVRLALINDDEIVVRGVASMLRRYGDRFQLVNARAGHPDPIDIALFDTFASHRRVDHRIQLLLGDHQFSKVVVYTWNFQLWRAQRLVDQGVAGYLPKSLTGAQLAEALTKVHTGSTVVARPPDHKSVVASDWPWREEGLTSREAEVLMLVAEGLSNAAIAQWMNVSLNTIKSYIRSTYRSIGAQSRSQAVLWAVGHRVPAAASD